MIEFRAMKYKLWQYWTCDMLLIFSQFHIETRL